MEAFENYSREPMGETFTNNTASYIEGTTTIIQLEFIHSWKIIRWLREACKGMIIWFAIETEL